MADTSTLTPPYTGRDNLLKVGNIIGYLFLLGTNIYTVFDGGAYQFGLGTFISPSMVAFSIWVPIHLLLLGTIIYQNTPEGKRVIIDGISWRFPLLTILTGIHILLWAKFSYIFAFVLAVFVTITMTHIYYILKKHYPAENITEELVIHWPFSLYHGWTTVLLVHTAYLAFGRYIPGGYHELTDGHRAFVFLSLFFFQAVGAVYAFCSSSGGDLPAAFAIDWALWSIFVHQDLHPRFVHRCALAFAILGLFWVIKATHSVLRYTGHGRIYLGGTSTDEHGPLLSS